MALVRAVNGAVDPSQNGKYAAPITTLATKIGLPQMLVEIRHEAAHQELPALPLLRKGAGAALAWLRRHYWYEQQAALAAREEATASLVGELVAAEVGASGYMPFLVVYLVINHRFLS